MKASTYFVSLEFSLVAKRSGSGLPDRLQRFLKILSDIIDSLASVKFLDSESGITLFMSGIRAADNHKFLLEVHSNISCATRFIYLKKKTFFWLSLDFLNIMLEIRLRFS